MECHSEPIKLRRVSRSWDVAEHTAPQNSLAAPLISLRKIAVKWSQILFGKPQTFVGFLFPVLVTSFFDVVISPWSSVYRFRCFLWFLSPQFSLSFPLAHSLPFRFADLRHFHLLHHRHVNDLLESLDDVHLASFFGSHKVGKRRLLEVPSYVLRSKFVSG